MSQWKRLVVPLLVVAIMLAACTADDATETTEATGDTGTTAADTTGTTAGDGTDTTAQPPTTSDATLIVTETFSPTRGWAIETDDGLVLSRAGITETLIRVDFDGTLQPWLAESWERRDDLTWAFTVRSGVTFHDGSTLDAEAVAFSINYVLDSPTPPRGLTRDIVASVEAEDETTVVITTVAPDAVTPLRLTSPSTAILSPSAYESGGTINPLAGSTGPFILVEEVPDQLLRLEANPDYWGDAPKVARVEVQFVPDGDVRAGLVRTGEAHIVQHVPVAQVPLLESEEGVTVTKTPLPRNMSVYLNNANGPTSELAVRQAINHAIDKALIASAVLEGQDEPAMGPWPSWEAWAEPDITDYAYDVSEAQRLLGEAGYGEDNPLTLRLWTYVDRPGLADVAVAIQAMLRDAGIAAELRVAEYVALEPDVLGAQYDMFILSRGHLLDVYDVIGFLQSDYTCDGGYNLSNYCNAEFDAAVTEAATVDDEAARYALYGELGGMLQDQAVNVFLTHAGQIDAHTDAVSGFQTHPLGHYTVTSDISLAG